MLKLSVVTACFNAAETIEATLASVGRQTYPAVEHIVIDGASTDGTLAIIERYRRDGLVVVSEPDSGISEAMNKGWALATGDFVLVLHADDVLVDDRALEMAAHHLADGADIVGFAVLKTIGGRQRRLPQAYHSPAMRYRCGTRHQGIFCRHGLIERLGPFDPTLRIAMDYDFFLRALDRGIAFSAVGEVLSVMGEAGISSRSDWPSLKIRFAEERLVQRRYARTLAQKALNRLFWALYEPYRSARHRL
ncbi:MAG: glycosyltransferase [Rhodospirillaceae bacterium]|nr:glycosyltransferase [Rhodospirillaceae bacterium]